MLISVCCFWSHIQTKNGDKDNEQLLLGLYSVSQANLNDQDYLQRILRTLVVKEWEENIDHYQGYLTEDLAPVTHAVLQNGHYTGDLMVLTLANVLNIPITVFTYAASIMCNAHNTVCYLNSATIFETGPGHYDAVIETTRTSKGLRRLTHTILDSQFLLSAYSVHHTYVIAEVLTRLHYTIAEVCITKV